MQLTKQQQEKLAEYIVKRTNTHAFSTEYRKREFKGYSSKYTLYIESVEISLAKDSKEIEPRGFWDHLQKFKGNKLPQEQYTAYRVAIRDNNIFFPVSYQESNLYKAISDYVEMFNHYVSKRQEKDQIKKEKDHIKLVDKVISSL